jgi:hypothetical protein
VIRYTRRLRVKRRAVRRARRYLRSTATVLRGARARISHRRSIARGQRVVYSHLNQQGRLLMRTTPFSGAKQARRQQLFTRTEQRRRLRAVQLIVRRTSTSNPLTTSQNFVRTRRASAKLRRRLTGYTSTLTPNIARPMAELTPTSDTIAPT